ncbi:ATP-binding cassette domain-containing protein [Gordonia soli]|uniref:Putative dipeptide ABC transporter ATP-binding protein n=1 Tax=Gordonia soli NBRC 108243 TaxID=1223545 RepID=M0QRX4_9ACTN|nr:ABC transporter ATP-binding protein [Gordonia soli]GAC70477.1 putative dipeptide ABC transporter ATP-binding protein [Gordonia soli NBRC 108243]
MTSTRIAPAIDTGHPSSDALLSIHGLSVRFPHRAGGVDAVTDLSLELPTDHVLALVGESGSGKSVTSSAIAGLLPASSRPEVSGSIRFHGQEIVGSRDKVLNSLRGSRIGTIFQNPATSFDPSFTIGNQLVELIRLHRSASRAEARDVAADWLERVGIADPARVLGSYPHQLSGGMRQRVMIAVACIPQPDLLIADEPTTALDPTLSTQILDLIDDLRRELGMAVLLVTHDFGVVARLSDSVAVLRHGRLVEYGSTVGVLGRPQQEYTQRLIAAVPELSADADRGDRPHDDADSTTGTPAPAAAVADVSKRFTPNGARPGAEFAALRDVSVRIERGRSLGLIGESGSGKSTLARIIAGIEPATEGSVTIHRDGQQIEIGRLSRTQRARQVQLVFQDHGSALNPRIRVADQIARPIRRLGVVTSGSAARRRSDELLDLVGLDPAALRDRYPHQLSGGQRQRVGIARALGVEPALIILDEPTSALDVTTQDEILDLLRELRLTTSVTYLLIAHDLAVVQAFADDVVVLDRGEVVDRFDARDFRSPTRHPVTRRLVDAVLPPRPVSR